MQINIHEFTTLALAHFIALISPGPDFILIVGHSIKHGFKQTTWACFGIACANGLYIITAICGFSLFRDHPLVFNTMKYAAAGYLFFLGWQLLHSKKIQPELAVKETSSAAGIIMFGRGFLSAGLNPKNAIFYLSLMSLIVSPETQVSQQFAYGLWMFTIVLCWDLFIVWSIGNNRSQKRFSHHSWQLERLCGTILVLVASFVLFK